MIESKKLEFNENVEIDNFTARYYDNYDWNN